MNGLRLDRRSSAFKPGLRRVVPGSSANSILYHRVAGNEFGPQMPPTGALKPEQIGIVKAWIDQGAEWPDALANEADLPPLNPKAVAMVDALRAGDRHAFLKFVAQDPKLLNARGPEGSTPFMYATLYGDAAFLEQLLKKGADPNARNDAKATALMWSATDIEKTRVLLAHGADVNAQADDARTPLMIAAGRPGNIALVKLLLDRGAEPNPTANPPGESSPLIQAALAADPDSMQLLMSRGAELKAQCHILFGRPCQNEGPKVISRGAQASDSWASPLPWIRLAWPSGRELCAIVSPTGLSRISTFGSAGRRLCRPGRPPK
jgi:ankyrin repeat protein